MTSTTSRALTAILAGAALAGCRPMSELQADETAGMNGGFEAASEGLPVNWLVYTPNTVPNADFDLVLDTDEPHSGSQSLRFDVREASRDGGWHSPGLSRQYDAQPGWTYTLGFWIESEGAAFRARFGGVGAKTGEYVTLSHADDVPEWRHFEMEYTLPDGFDELRFEFNVVRAGTLRIDDVTLSGVD